MFLGLEYGCALYTCVGVYGITAVKTEVIQLKRAITLIQK